MTGTENQEIGDNMVGPVMRSGSLAEAVIDAVTDDNPEQHVHVFDRGDYVRIHTERNCRLTKASIEKHLGRSFELALLEAEMPSFKGRMESSTGEMRWFYNA
jgi:MmoB/DmpM family